MSKTLTNKKEIVVRFSECDALKMVWHGNYVKYFEDGRESFGKQYGLEYLQLYENAGFVAPIIHLNCDYKKMVGLSETITVETTYVDTPAAKMIFEYKIFNQKKELVCTGKTIQVFLDTNNRELMITVPPFLQQWKATYLK